MKVIFFGTPSFSVPTLKKLIQSTNKVVAVVTQPDKPVGRSNKPSFSPVKQVALDNGIKVLQYEKVSRDGVEELKKLNADVMVTCAYGQILSQEVLDITPFGVINVHGSLLPKYRGAAPIQWAIINGETTTGITILRSEAGMDDGDIITLTPVQIEENETSEQLFDRLSVIGADCLIHALDLLQSGKATFTPQNNALATKCKMIKVEMSKIDFNNTSRSIVNLVRGLIPWPVASMAINGVHFKVYKAQEVLGFTGDNGCVVVSDNKHGLVIKTSDSAVEILELQADGKKRMTAKAYLNGNKIMVGSRIE